jgi:hypothetical protein
MRPKTFDDPVLDALFRYWNDKRGERSLPDRSVIDPLEMGASLLPHLLLCDLAERGARIRFRLVGTEIVKRFGFDPTGQFLSEVPEGAYFDALGALHLVAFLERAPVYSESRFRWGVNRRLDVRHLLLPLTNGGTLPDIALLGLSFRSAELFPPPLRALARDAQHVELSRAVLTPDDDAIMRAPPVDA